VQNPQGLGCLCAKHYVLKRVMRLITLFLAIFSAGFVSGAGAERRITVDAFIGKELVIDTQSAGASITVIKTKERYWVCHKVFGSGVPVISAIKYPAKKHSQWQLWFALDKANNFVLSVTESNELELRLNGYKLHKPLVADKVNNQVCTKS